MPGETAPLSDQWTIVEGFPMLFRVTTEAAPIGKSPIVHVHDLGITGRSLAPTAERLAPIYPSLGPRLARLRPRPQT